MDRLCWMVYNRTESQQEFWNKEVHLNLAGVLARCIVSDIALNNRTLKLRLFQQT